MVGMALIACPECGNEVSDKAPVCLRCGMPIAAASRDVKVRFPVWHGQIFNTGCSVLVNGREVARCRQGETATFELTEETEIQVKVSGGYGAPKIIAAPGDRFEVGYRGFGKVFIAKVDVLA